MPTGTVVYFAEDGGYGFIESEARDEDIYFHMTDLGGPDVEEGDKLQFDIVEEDKGPRAENISLV